MSTAAIILSNSLFTVVMPVLLKEGRRKKSTGLFPSCNLQQPIYYYRWTCGELKWDEVLKSTTTRETSSSGAGNGNNGVVCSFWAWQDTRLFLGTRFQYVITHIFATS